MIPLRSAFAMRMRVCMAWAIAQKSKPSINLGREEHDKATLSALAAINQRFVDTDAPGGWLDRGYVTPHWTEYGL